MKRRGMIMVRAQYSFNKKTGRRNMRTKTAADLAGLRNYLDDPEHVNHDGVRILPCKPWRTTLDVFTSGVVAAAEAYRANAPSKAGARWCGDIGEHLIAAPDTGSDLSDEEIELIATRILEQVSPRSPAVWAAHFDPKTKTWEIHFAISSFTEDLLPELRVVDLRRRQGSDYGLIIDEAGFAALKEANQRRILKGLLPIRSLADLHAEKIAAVVDVLSRHSESAGPAPTVRELLALFQGSSWSPLKHTKTSVSLVSAEFSTPLHVRWAVLREALSRRFRDKSVRDDHDRKLRFQARCSREIEHKWLSSFTLRR